MILKGRSISSGSADGKVLKLTDPFSFLGGVDGSTGELRVENGGNVAGRILVFPMGKGSTVGSFTMYDLKVHGKNPAAIINRSAETIVTTGAVISGIPMVDRIDVDLISDGDRVIVNGDDGTVELPGVKMIESSSSAVMKNGKVLMLKRPDSVTSFPGKWSLVAGKIEKGEDPEQTAIREIMEETQISVKDPISSIDPILVREGAVIWKVHMFLFEVDDAVPILNEENEGFEWVLPENIHSHNAVSFTREAVMRLIGQPQNLCR